ncbi:3-oxoadipate enol-lactonase [Glycomyces salinus]|uniref:3-oxoadipate enol-lactonase n=1 Tax=Glycomyces salinus TaxID=980294 RepID=UPI0018EA7FEC|nr:3-oxoadipate enol-lactonase [Glycomyces salinus]
MIPSYSITGSGYPVVLVNSLGTVREMWGPQVEPLSKRFQVVRFDARGHGPTPAPLGEWTVDDLAGDITDLLDGLGIERAHVVGVSLGGATAMRLAVRDPDRVDRLVLASAAPRFGTPDAWRERAATVLDSGTAAISGATMDRWFSPGFQAERPKVVAQFREAFDACDARGYAACCGVLERLDLSDQVDRIAAPTLVVGGSDDPSTTAADARALAARVPGARLKLYEGARHLLTAEAAEAFNVDLIDFLDEGA